MPLTLILLLPGLKKLYDLRLLRCFFLSKCFLELVIRKDLKLNVSSASAASCNNASFSSLIVYIICSIVWPFVGGDILPFSDLH